MPVRVPVPVPVPVAVEVCSQSQSLTTEAASSLTHSHSPPPSAKRDHAVLPPREELTRLALASPQAQAQPTDLSPISVQVVTLKPAVPPGELTKLFRNLCKLVLDDGGIVRCIENHGVRSLAYRFRARQGIENEMYFTHGRWVSIYMDAKPPTISKVERELNLHEGYLRSNVTRPRIKMDYVNSSKRTNPWSLDENRQLPYVMQEALRLEREMLEAETATEDGKGWSGQRAQKSRFDVGLPPADH